MQYHASVLRSIKKTPKYQLHHLEILPQNNYAKLSSSMAILSTETLEVQKQG